MKQEYKLEAELFGYVKALPKEVIKNRYENLSSYEKLIRFAAETCVDNGLLLREDMEECIRDAVKKAAEDGLK